MNKYHVDPSPKLTDEEKRKSKRIIRYTFTFLFLFMAVLVFIDECSNKDGDDEITKTTDDK